MLQPRTRGVCSVSRRGAETMLHVSEPPPVSTKRAMSPWIWPPLAVALVAVGGYSFGALGVLLAAGSGAAVLVLVADQVFTRSDGARWVAVAATAAGVVVVVLVLWRSGPDNQEAPDAVSTSSSREESDRHQLLQMVQPGARIPGVNLQGLDLSSRRLDGLFAAGATLVDVDLSGSSLRGADLRGADLTGACLLGTDLAGADLAGARVTNASLDENFPVSGSVGEPLPLGRIAGGCPRP